MRSSVSVLSASVRAPRITATLNGGGGNGNATAFNFILPLDEETDSISEFRRKSNFNLDTTMTAAAAVVLPGFELSEYDDEAAEIDTAASVESFSWTEHLPEVRAR